MEMAWCIIEKPFLPIFRFEKKHPITNDYKKFTLGSFPYHIWIC